MTTHHKYNCLMVYYTPTNFRRCAHVKTIAKSEAEALVIAAKLLHHDKRRSIGRITDGKAIQQ